MSKQYDPPLYKDFDVFVDIVNCWAVHRSGLVTLGPFKMEAEAKAAVDKFVEDPYGVR